MGPTLQFSVCVCVLFLSKLCASLLYSFKYVHREDRQRQGNMGLATSICFHNKNMESGIYMYRDICFVEGCHFVYLYIKGEL